MTNEKLEQLVRDSAPLTERLQKCTRIIGELCRERRPPSMSIPVQWYDEDFFMSVTLSDAIDALAIPQEE